MKGWKELESNGKREETLTAGSEIELWGTMVVIVHPSVHWLQNSLHIQHHNSMLSYTKSCLLGKNNCFISSYWWLFIEKTVNNMPYASHYDTYSADWVWSGGDMTHPAVWSSPLCLCPGYGLTFDLFLWINSKRTDFSHMKTNDSWQRLDTLLIRSWLRPTPLCEEWQVWMRKREWAREKGDDSLLWVRYDRQTFIDIIDSAVT